VREGLLAIKTGMQFKFKSMAPLIPKKRRKEVERGSGRECCRVFGWFLEKR
jgi:hypothetical protein